MADERSFFRREPEQARAAAWLGRVVLIRPVSFTFLTLCALAFSIVLALFFVAGEYTRKARVTGVLAPVEGVAKIIAQQSGIVEALHIREGDRVQRDAVLMVLGDGRASRAREDVGQAISSRVAERRRLLLLQTELAAAALRSEQEAFARRGTGFEREIAEIDAEIASQSKRMAIASDGVDRARRLKEIGFLSSAALDHERDAELDHESRLDQLRRTRVSLARELAAIEFDAHTAQTRARSQLASLDMQRASLDQERIERDLQYHAAIVAPMPGVVATVLVEPGQMVTAGTPLATIIPENATLEAVLYSPSRSIGFVHAGQDVLLRYLAYPYQKFGMHRASVTSVSRNPMLPGELGFTPIDGTREPVYRIKVALEGQAIRAYGRLEPLQPGMQVEADILLDKRRLIEWVFEPLLSLAGRA
ncbi:MAG: HlyD family secretion protein [Usitatibacter sp.]